jgi:hypothetical protein
VFCPRCTASPTHPTKFICGFPILSPPGSPDNLQKLSLPIILLGERYEIAQQRVLK